MQILGPEISLFFEHMVISHNYKYNLFFFFFFLFNRFNKKISDITFPKIKLKYLNFLHFTVSINLSIY